ncbi:MAG: VCBS domain-containing protein [Fimbriimonadaceae bacterium]
MRLLSVVSTAASVLALTACGGGGGEVANSPATISGDTLGVITLSAGTTASGRLVVSDPDAGQSVFRAPASLAGTYGTWAFDSTTGAWLYTADANRVGNAQGDVQDVLTVTSKDGSATVGITVRVSQSGMVYPVTSVPAPIYSGADPYASEKVAVFNRLNDDRNRCGFGMMSQNPKLDTAAQGHADYLKLAATVGTSHYQQVGNPGFTGVTPGDRVVAAGYSYSLGIENISGEYFGQWYASGPNGSLFSPVERSATFDLRGLLSSPYHLAGLMGPTFEVGFGVSKKVIDAISDSNAKFLVVSGGVPTGVTPQYITGVRTFPCEGATNLSPAFIAELPDPFPDFPNTSRQSAPYGQPVYVAGAPGTTTTLTSGVIQAVGGAAVPTRWLNSANDPNGLLGAHEVILAPTQRLADNTTYSVTLVGTNTGEVTLANPTGAFTKTFTFQTGTF